MSRFARVLLATTALSAGLTAAAVAADLRPAYKGPPPVAAPVPYNNWSGFYIGGHAGGGWAEDSDSAFIGGGQIGYNWQFAPNWLIGIEGDFSGSSLGQSTSGVVSVDSPIGPLPVDQSASFDLNWMASIRGRIGYTFDRFMVYFTGGVAWADVEATQTASLSGFGLSLGSASASGTVTGWVVGGGGEWMFAPNWTLGVEYLHYDFDSVSGTGTFLGVTEPFNVDVGSVDVVRARLNYKFGDWFGKAPVAARY